VFCYLPLLGCRVPPRACRLLLLQHLHLQQLQQHLQEHYALAPATTLHTYTPELATIATHVRTSTCRLLLLQHLHLQQLQQHLQQQYALNPATTPHTCTCTSYTLALHVGTRT
jgi:hypothetical protein